MKQYKTAQVRIHSVGPLIKGDSANTHDRRNVSFQRVTDNLLMETFNAYLVGQDAHTATLRLGHVMELSYYAMNDGGKFIVGYQYIDNK